MSTRNWIGVALVVAAVLGYCAVWVREFGWRSFGGAVLAFAAMAAFAAAVTWCFA